MGKLGFRGAATAALVLSAAVLSAQGAHAQPPAGEPDWATQPRDWGETLRRDATAFHAVILDSHPGPVDPLNPQFRARLDAGLALALERAETARDVGGWWWAMRALQAGFDDGHVQLWLNDQSYGFPVRWTGVITAWRNGAQIVVSRDETDASAPPLGARLVDCDGTAAEILAEQRVGVFRGRWSLEAQRVNHGHETLLNLSNPWLADLGECRFENDGVVRSRLMVWRPIPPADLGPRLAEVRRSVRPDFDFRELEDGGFWISMPTFDGTPGGEPHAALTAILAEAAERQAELRAAPYLVLDLRGNGGGSSHWSGRLADILWNEAWRTAHRQAPIEGVDWRASEANTAVLAEFLDDLTASDGDPDLIAWARAAAEGMAGARAAGLDYWRQGGAVRLAPEAAVETGAAPVNPMRGRVYVLTDSACGSACLDAVDLWKPMGVVQVGRETSADTVYMEVRDQALPSGLANMAVPMKVYRGRPRGNNEPHRPAHVFDGDMRDEAAVLAWVRALP